MKKYGTIMKAVMIVMHLHYQQYLRLKKLNDSKAKAIINWTVGLLIILQARYYVPNAAVNVLIKFLSILFKVLGQSSPVAAIIEKSFFTSFNVMCKNIHHNETFVKYIVCSSCNQIYQLDDCAYTVGSQEYSKKCTYVEYPITKKTTL